MRNQFGGTIGGPVSIPHLYIGKDKSFFFFGIQATRLRTAGVGGTSILPTPAQLAGTISGLASATALKNPTTLAPYPCTPLRQHLHLPGQPHRLQPRLARPA